MNNKGQTTVFFSFIICVLLLFTLTAFEVIRLHTGKVAETACVHSMRTSIMADYDSELFERYHLLFIDPTYGTDGTGYLEEKIKSYLDVSLNGQESESSIYQYHIDDIVVSDEIGILDNDMELLKQQIIDYEEMAGITDFNRSLSELKETHEGMDTGMDDLLVDGEADKINNDATMDSESQGTEGGVKDPRDTLSSILDGGILNIVMPKHSLSLEKRDLKHISKDDSGYGNVDFTDIHVFADNLDASVKHNKCSNYRERASYINYFCTNFSNGVHPYEDTVMKCELEYLLKGRSSDAANMEAVAKDLIWLRVPINYVYLISDSKKTGEAEVVATAICTATGTLEFEKVVTYLLLGCWAYGESLYDVKDLLSGECVPYVKNSDTWKTDLQTLTDTGFGKKTEKGIYYEEYLFLLFTIQSDKQMNDSFLRMLDIIELNLQQNNPDFHIENYAGKMNVQGKISITPLFSTGGSKDKYEYYFDENISYEMN